MVRDEAGEGSRSQTMMNLVSRITEFGLYLINNGKLSKNFK